MRSLRTLLLIAALAAPTLASAQDVPATAPATASATGAHPPRHPAPDLSRSVTLTGNELQALIAAVRAEAQAQAVVAAAGSVSAKITEAMTPPAPAPAEKAE